MNANFLTDVVFLVGDEKLLAHRCVLAAHSPIFQTMLYETNSEGVPDVTLTKPIEVKIKDITPAVFKAFLTALYKDEIEVNAENIDGLMKVSRKYQVDKVRLLCAEFMEQDINKDNAVELFLSGPSIMGDEEFGLRYIEENAEEVLKSDAIAKLPADRFAIILKSDKLKTEELAVFKALVKWGEARVKESTDKIDLKTATKDLIKYVRFPLLQMNDMATIVAPSNLIEPSQLVGLFSYLSVTDEKVRSLLPNPGFETKEREGTVTWDVKKEVFKLEEINAVGEWLKKKPQKWKKLYQATKDGWSGSRFHTLCDGKGPTVVFVKLTNKYVFGGYTKESWGQGGRLVRDDTAFLFRLSDGSKTNPLKCTIKNVDHAINWFNSGLQFGSNNDLCINLDSRSGSHSYMGQTYNLPTGFSNQQTFLAGVYTSWEFEECSVYSVP